MRLIGLWLLLSLGFALTLEAQTTRDSINLGNVKVAVNANGNLFKLSSGRASLDREGFEAPAGSGNGLFFSSAPWIGAKTMNDRLKVSIGTYEETNDFDFRTGPVADTYNTQYFDRYDRLWKITRNQIERHRNQFNEPDYTAPEVIRNWPARKRPALGVDRQLAPFVDANGDGVYDPDEGDYPDIRGDVAVFFIINDDRATRDSTRREPLTVELRSMVYAFDQPTNPALANAIFVNYRIANISNQDYKDTYFGQFADFDIGYSYDDYVGCDPQRQLFYSYNGDNFDENNYGNQPPAAGISFLNTPLNGFMSYENDFSPTGNPEQPIHYYRYLQSIWKDGLPITTDSAGRNPDTTITKYLFPGDPSNPEEWSMRSEGLLPTDQRGLGTAGPFTLEAGDQLCVDLAFSFARDTTQTFGQAKLGSIRKLRQRQDSIAAFYAGKDYNCPAVDSFSLRKTSAEQPPEAINLYPNPAHDQLTIELTASEQQVQAIMIYNARGRLVRNPSPASDETQVQVEDLKPGFYVLRAHTADGIYTRKWLKQ